jgi:hypothetical protein
MGVMKRYYGRRSHAPRCLPVADPRRKPPPPPKMFHVAPGPPTPATGQAKQAAFGWVEGA